MDLPHSLTHLGDGPFATCSSLNAIRVATGNPAYRSVDGLLFDLPQTRLLQYPVGKPGPYAVPSGVTHLGSSAFAGCQSLTNGQFSFRDPAPSVGVARFYRVRGP